MEVIHELPQEVASGQHEAPRAMVIEDHCFPGLRSGHSLAAGRAVAHEIRVGSTRPWRNSSIRFSFTQEPSQDPLGRWDGASSSSEAAPFSFCRDALGAIWVRI
jgi:hypothetical protein